MIEGHPGEVARALERFGVECAVIGSVASR